MTTESMRSVAWNGRLVVVGFASGTIANIPANRLLLKNVAALGVSFGEYPKNHPDLVREIFADLVALQQAGHIQSLVRDTFKLADLPLAPEALASRKTVGKVVVTP